MQQLQMSSQTNQVEVEDDVTTEALECSKENRVVFHAQKSVNSNSPPRKAHRTPPKRLAAEHALQSMKRMREHDNALSSKIIQNLQNDKAAFAQKMEELQGALNSSKQRCVALESSASRLVTENEKLEEANNTLQGEVQDLHEAAALQASAISQLEAELQEERAKGKAEANPSEAELLQIAKRYLKHTLRLQRAAKEQIRPANKSEWQLDSMVAQCNGCSKRFGTFLRRHHCRGCGKLFCSACCQDTLNLHGEAEDSGVLSMIDGMSLLRTSEEQKGPFRGRSCKGCFKLVEETATKRRQLREQSKVELRAMEDWLARPEVDLDALLADS